MEENKDNIDNFSLMVMTATITDSYDDWKDKPEIKKALNGDNNKIYKMLKQSYPESSEKIIQSVSLAFLINMLNIINNNTFEIYNDDNEYDSDVISVD
jgi:hypothetical protein